MADGRIVQTLLAPTAADLAASLIRVGEA
jgi:hypothetical protein